MKSATARAQQRENVRETDTADRIKQREEKNGGGVARIVCTYIHSLCTIYKIRGKVNSVGMRAGGNESTHSTHRYIYDPVELLEQLNGVEENL